MADIAKIALELDSAPLARGVAQARKLLAELTEAAGGAGRGVGGVGGAGRKAGDELGKAGRSALQYSQALAALQRSTGDYSGAVKTLTDQLGKLDRSSVSALRVQTQIANIQNQAKRVGEGATFSGFLGGFKKIEDQLGTLSTKFTAFGNLPGLGFLGKLGGQADTAASSMKGLGVASSASSAGLATAGLAIGGVVAAIGAVTVAAVAGSKALFDFALAGSNAADDLNDVALITGISAEKLQVIKAAAIQSGSSLEDFTRAAAVFGQKMEEISKSPEKAAKFIKAFGIDAKAAAEAPEAALLQLGSRLSEVESSTQRVAIAKELMGKAGLKLIPTLATLSAEGGKFGKTMEENGEIISTQSLIIAGELSDAVAGLGSKFESLSIKIATATGPTFEKSIDRMGDAMNRLTPIAVTVANAIAQKFQDTVNEIDILVRVLEAHASKVLGFLERGGRGIRAIAEAEAGRTGRGVAPPSSVPDDRRGHFRGEAIGSSGQDAAIQSFLDVKDGKRAGGGGRAAAKIPELSELAKTQLDVLGAQADLAGKDLNELRRAMEESQRNIYRWSQALQIFAETGQTKTREFAQAQDALNKETARMTAILAAFKLPPVSLDRSGLFGAIPAPLPVGGPNSLADLIRSLPSTETPGIGNRATQAMETAAKALEIVAQKQPGFRDEFFGRKFVDEGGFNRRTRGAADDITEDFLRGIISGRQNIREAAAGLAGDFADFLGDFASRKINEILRKQLERSFDALGDFLGGVLGKLFGGLKNKFGGFFGDILGAIFPSFGGFKAGGGDVGPGRFYVVGEKGPELFAPNTAGNVIPNGAAFATGGGGGPITVVNNFHGIRDMADFKRNSNEINRQIAASVEQGNRMRGAR